MVKLHVFQVTLLVFNWIISI